MAEGSEQPKKRPRQLNLWSEEAMARAVAACLEQKRSGGSDTLRHIAKECGIPPSTLERRVNGKVAGTSHTSGRPTALSSSEEDELCHLLKLMSQRGFPLSERQVRDLATDYAIKNGISAFQQSKGKCAGYYWLCGFLQRHPELKVKKPEGLSAARAQAVNEHKVNDWFGTLKGLMEDCDIFQRPTHIWNLDESGLQDVFQSRRAVGETGKPLYQLQAAEKGDTTTIVPVFNAVGTVATVMVIFKGARLKPDLYSGMPSGMILRCSKDGWINKELFLDLGRKFVQFLTSNNQTPGKHILLLDGHGSHLYNVEFLELMKQNNVEVYCFPPHTSHILQPADISLFKSLKSHWHTEGLEFTRKTGGKKVGRNHFFEVFVPAWLKSATVENIQSGFRRSGIFPFNPDAVPKNVFLPSLTTERQTVTDVEPTLTESAAKEDVASTVTGGSESTTPANLSASSVAGQSLNPATLTSHNTAVQQPVIINYIQVSSLDLQLLQQLESGGNAVVISDQPLLISDLVSQQLPTTQNELSDVSLISSLPDDITSSLVLDCDLDLTMSAAAMHQASVPLSGNVLTDHDGSVHGQLQQESIDVTDDIPASQLLNQDVPSDCNPSLTSEILNTPAAASQASADVISEEETIGTEVKVPFSSLCHFPQREKSVRKRKKPPSYRLTSKEHMEYISNASVKKVTSCSGNSKNVDNKTATRKRKRIADENKKDKRAKRSRKSATRKGLQGADDPRGPCAACSWEYSDPDDPRLADEWIQCKQCNKWYHQTCAEENGVFDDLFFYCKSCC